MVKKTIISQLNLHLSLNIRYTCKPRGPLKAPNNYTKAVYKKAVKPQVKATPTKYIELHYSLRDTEKLIDLVIKEPLANSTPMPFSLIFAGNISLSRV